MSEENPKTFEADVELQRGDAIVIHYENAPLYGVTGKPPTWKAQAPRLLEYLLTSSEDPELGAAWMKAGYQRGDNGWSWYKRIEALRAEGELDLHRFDADSPEVRASAEYGANPPTGSDTVLLSFRERARYRHPSHGNHWTATLDEDVEEAEQKRITERFLGKRGERDDREYAEAILRPLIDTAFRRPTTKEQVEKYLNMALRHQAKGHRFEDGIHRPYVLCSVPQTFLPRTAWR